MHELQLAKAAVRAGFELLLQRLGIGCEDLDMLYIAGGFGFYMDIKKAAAIGMVPRELLKKTQAVGNTSLSGAIQFLTDPQGKVQLEALVKNCEEISLSRDSSFQELFLEHLKL